MPKLRIQKESWVTVQDSAGGGYEIWKYAVMPTIHGYIYSLELSLELYLLCLRACIASVLASVVSFCTPTQTQMSLKRAEIHSRKMG